MYLLIIGAADSLFVSRKLLQCYKNRLEKEVEEIQFSTDWASDKMCQVTVFCQLDGHVGASLGFLFRCHPAAAR